MRSDFTHNVTHELKTPIAVAYAANDALLHFDRWEDVATRERYLNISQEQLQRLSGMVEQILSVSTERQRTFVLKPELLNVKDVVEAMVDALRLKCRKPLTIGFDISPEGLTLKADRIQLVQMLDNLVDNGIKYSAEEADIRIRALVAEDGTTLISVSDHGIGIPSDQQRHIFEKFYRVPHGNLHDVKGYGLGLYYVKTMMRLHSGRVSVESRMGEGSTFTLHFPKTAPHALNSLAWFALGIGIALI